MNKIFTLLLFSFITSIGFSQASENFNYTLGDSLSLKAGGIGFGDNWKVLKANAQVKIGQGGITIDALGSKTSGNHLNITHNAGQAGPRFFRKLAQPVTDDGKTYYMSWAMKSDYTNPAANGSVCQAMIASSTAYTANGPNGQLLRFGKIFNSEKFGIDGTKLTSPILINDTDTRNANWVVVMIKMSGDANRENFYVFINPTPNNPLDTTKANTKFTAEFNTGFDAIGGKLEGPAALNGVFDDLKFGATLADVTPTDLSLVPVTAVEEFAYLAGDSLNGKNGGTGFGGSWTFRSGSNQAKIAEKGSDINAIDQTTSNNSLFIDHAAGAANSRFFRLLKNPVTDDGQTYYMGWAMDTDYENPTTNGSVMQAMIVKSAGYLATGAGGQTVRMGKIFNSEKFGIDGQRIVGTLLADNTDTRNGYYAVAMLTMSGDAQREKMFVFINPSLSTTTLDTSKADIKFTVDLNDGFDAIGAKVEGPQAVKGRIDDLKFSPNLADVFPKNLSKTVPPNTIIAIEKFEYAAADSLGGVGKLENGFKGGWLDLNSKKSAKIVNRGLINETLLARTNPSSLEINSTITSNRYLRYFNTPIDSASKEIWFSVQMASKGNSTNNVGSLLLVDSTKTGENFQHVIIGKQFNSQNIFAAGNGQVGGPTLSGKTFNGTTANWLVGKLSHANGRWSMTMWVDPDPSMTPDTSKANIKNKLYNNAVFHGLGIRAEGSDGLQYLVDDIIIGKVFTDVVPIDLTKIGTRPGKVSEKFEYAAGTNLIGQNGGTGFAGAYQLISGIAPTVTEGGVRSAKLLKQTSGRKLEVKPRQSARIVRKLDGEYGDNGREYWIGYFFNSPNGSTNVAHLVLADSSTYTSAGAGGQLLQVGQIFGGSLGTVPGRAIPGLSAKDGYYIVMNVVTNGNPTTNDEVFLWVDPALNRTPSRDSAIKINVNLAKWNSLGFKVEYSPDSLVAPVWDDIAIGEKYSDVVPSDLIDIDPPVFAEVGYEGFNYTAGSQIRDANGGTGWSDTWKVDPVTSNAISTAPSIQSDRVNPTGNKLTIEQANTTTTVTRKFKAPIADEGGVFWSSVLIDVEKKDIGNGVHFLYTNKAGKEIVGFGGIQGISKFAYLDDKLANTVDQNTELVGPKWVVTRIEVNKEGADKVYVWLNPSADAIPNIVNASYQFDANFDGGIAGIKINTFGVQTSKTNIDEIRTGFAFRDVSSKFGSSDPNLLAYEPFNYDQNSSVIGSGGENAFWLNAWSDGGQQSDNKQSIAKGSLTIEGFQSIGNKARLELREASKQLRIDRNLATPIKNDGKTYWLSFLMFSEDTPVRNQVGNLTLRSSAISNNAGQVMSFGRIFGNGKLGLVTPQTNTISVTDLDDKGLSWIVVKIRTTGTTVNDSVFMWVNPNPSSEPSEATALIKRETNAFKSNVDIIRIRTEGSGADQIPYNVEFDEIRLATTWQSAKLLTSNIEIELNDNFSILAYPNPANDRINMEIEVQSSKYLSVDIFSTSGEKVKSLLNEEVSSGNSFYTWDISMLKSGIYFVRASDGAQSNVQKLIIIK